MWKHRSKTLPGAAYVSYPIEHGDWPGLQSSDLPFTISYDDHEVLYEAFKTEVGNRSDWNACEHYKRTREFGSGQIQSEADQDATSSGPWFEYLTPTRYNIGSTGVGGQSFPWGSAYDPTTGLPALYTVSSAAEGVIPPPNWSDLVEDSYATLLPGIRPRISALNSIYELKDIKSIPHTLARLSKGLDSIAALKRAVISAAKAKRLSFGVIWSRPLRSILKAVGDAYLQKEFNIEPLLSDLNSVRVATQNVRKQINKLLADEGKPKKHHYRRSLAPSYPDVTRSVSIPFSEGFVDSISVCTYTTTLFHAELEYSFTLKDYERAEALPRGLLDNLGINVDPGVIWRAIPWSFVVDWFVGVSRFLSQFAQRNIEPVTYVRRYCASMKVERVITTSYGSRQLNFTQSPIPRCTVFESAYARQIAKPGINSPRANDLNSHEFWLSGALAVTR
jgi:hypothetical protein